MPYYIPKSLESLKNPKTKKPQCAPHRYNTPAYDQRLQMTPEPDSSPLLINKYKTFIQSVVRTLLYYARSLDTTILRAINELSRVQYKPTIETLAKA